MKLQTKAVGQTGLRVTDVSFGCASIGNLFREVSDADAQAVLQTAWDAGIRYFDTAPHYGRGLSEARLGAFLKDKPRDSFVVSTKVGRVLSPGAQQSEADGFINPLPNDVRYDYSDDGIAASIEGSRERLGLDQIDIAYVHDLGPYTHGDASAAHLEMFLGSGYDHLVHLKEQGGIGAFGLGVNENEICLDVMDHGPVDVILLAGRLTLLDRSGGETLVPRCLENGTSLVLGGIFNSGILATGAKPGATYDYAPASDAIKMQVDALQAKARDIDMSLAEAAIQFARMHPAVASVLIGTAKSTSLLRNLDLAKRPIPAEFSKVFQ